MHSAKNCEVLPKKSPVTLPGTPLNPSPYEPLANRPKDSTPQAPHVPCTLEAPTGSSILRVFSMNIAETTTSTPATAPIKTACGAPTNAHGAVMATSPASMPLASHVGSGFPKRVQTYRPAANAPDAEASM